MPLKAELQKMADCPGMQKIFDFSGTAIDG
jgi:hypothetical protein